MRVLGSGRAELERRTNPIRFKLISTMSQTRPRAVLLKSCIFARTPPARHTACVALGSTALHSPVMEGECIRAILVVNECNGELMNRRRFLLGTALVGTCAHSLSACGGSGSTASQSTESGDLVQWTIDPSPLLIAGELLVVVDLAASLPTGVRRGGRFQVSPLGSRLPVGVLLSTSGILSLTSEATEGLTLGVVFRYDEPA